MKESKMNYVIRRRADDKYMNINGAFQPTFNQNTFFSLQQVNEIRAKIGENNFDKDYLFYIIIGG